MGRDGAARKLPKYLGDVRAQASADGLTDALSTQVRAITIEFLDRTV